MMLFMCIPAGLADEAPVETPASSNADLSSLEVSGYELDPAFDASTTDYTVSVSSEVYGVEIFAATADINATLEINGNEVSSGEGQTVDNLDVGDNEAAVVVTAEDGTTVKTYTIIITRAEAEIEEPAPADSEISSDADLNSLSVAEYELIPDFEAGTTGYAVSIPNDVESVDITATTADENASLTIAGTAAISGSAQTVGDLAEGDNIVDVEVTAEDGNTVQTYTITITRAEPALQLLALEASEVSSNADLSSLALTDYAIDPAFGSETTGYTAEVPNEVDSVEITATVADANATLTIGGAAAVSGTPQTVSGLVVGENDIAVAVTAQDTTTVKAYTITVTRVAVVSSNADLSSLSVTGYNPTPVFDAAATEYSVCIPGEVESVEITATIADANSTITIGGAAAISGTPQTVSGLVMGENEIAVVVTAQDGTTVKTYTLIITRVAAYATALSSLEVTGYTLIPPFTVETVEYAISIPNDVESVDITATTADENATITIGGAAAVSGTPQTVSGLLEGMNTVNIQVTSADGNTSNSYIITITRTGAGDLPQTPEAYAASDWAEYGSRIAGGRYFAATVLQDGTIEVWGDNSKGVLVVPSEATGIKAMFAIYYQIAALKEDGTVVVWGSNYDAPADLAGKSVKAVAANNNCVAALTEDNQIYLWGSYNGVLSSTSELVDIAMNSKYLLALAADGTVEAWQCNGLASYAVPAGFSGDVVDIEAGYSQSLALKKDGTVVGWDDTVPADLSGVRAITGGRNFSAAICQDGTVTVWGDNTYGQCDVPSGLQAEAIEAGYYGVYALKPDGSVAAWGRNDYGECDVREDLNLYSEVSTQDRLISLAVESGDGNELGIHPEFNCVQTGGGIDIPYAMEEVHITAQAYSSTAALTINGDLVTSGETFVINSTDLDVGDNLIEIIVTAASGSQRSYILNIRRVSEGFALPALPQTPEAYQNSDYAVYSRRLASNYETVLAVKKDGTVIAWGQGQIRNIPPDVVDVKAVAAGQGHSLALKEDGTVVAWGNNDDGQCDVPADLTDVVDITIVDYTSFALDKNGKITAWGRNQYGEANIPETLTGVVDIQGGSRYMLALKADGTVTAWGDNYFNQLAVPADLDHVVAVAAAFRHCAALKDDGTIVIWGAEGTNYPIENTNPQYVKGIAAGSEWVAVLKWDGSLELLENSYSKMPDIPWKLDKEILAVSACGSVDQLLYLNEDGTVGTYAEESRYGITDIPSWLNLLEDDVQYNWPSPDIPQTPAEYAASDYVQAAAKICRASGGYAILNMDGTVRYIQTSGDDYYGLAEVPEGLSHVTAIDAQYTYNIMALQEDGSVTVWGINDDGQCQVPENVQDITAITSTRTKNNCCLALKNDGTVIAWGNDSYGQCQVPEGLNEVTAIAAGSDHFLALKANGTVVAWGDNDYGQCDVPEGLNDVARVFAQYDFSLALKNDGTVVAWGSNYDTNGRLYQGQCDVPEGLNGVVDIRIMGQTCIALKNNGTVVVWGDNYYGSLNVHPDLHDVAAIGNAFVDAIKIDGTVEVWGYSSYMFSDGVMTGLNNVLTVSNDIVIFRDGSLRHYEKDDVTAMLEGLNVLSGHYFNIDEVNLLNSAGNPISTVASQGGYRIQAGIDNNYASPTNGLTIIQVRGGESANSESGGQVMGCVGISSVIPVSGSTVSSDFTLPAGISGEAYVDVFVWEDWETMVPRAAANQDLSFTVSE